MIHNIKTNKQKKSLLVSLETPKLYVKTHGDMGNNHICYRKSYFTKTDILYCILYVFCNICVFDVNVNLFFGIKFWHLLCFCLLF